MRLRTSPAYVPVEAERFVKLLSAATSSQPTALDRAVGRELRVGALAGVGPDELEALFLVWRRTLDALPVEVSRSDALWRAFEMLRRRVSDAWARWNLSHIDYVLVGASAGGIPALRELLSGLDEKFPATVLIVMHVSESTPSVLPSILRAATPMTIAFAVDHADPYRGVAYVAPTGRHLILEGDKLRFSLAAPVRFARPSVDVLFESAAASAGSRAASVVLSGSGSDGEAGTRAIDRAGGITFAQDPATAEFQMMPQRAIEAGVNYVASPHRIAELLKAIICEGRRPRS